MLCISLFCACLFPLIVAENDVTNGYSYMPISERVKLFTKKFEEGDISSSARKSNGIHRSGSRFSTQPVTKNEVRVAKIDFLASTIFDAEQVGRCHDTKKHNRIGLKDNKRWRQM